MRISDWSSDVCSSDLLVDRPPLPLIFINQGCQHIETSLVRAARFRAPESADFIDRRPMVVIVPDRSDIHLTVLHNCSTVDASLRSYPACVPINLMRAIPLRT